MSFSIEDIKRAITGNGDVSSFLEVYLSALGKPPVSCHFIPDIPISLPEPTLFAEHLYRGITRANQSEPTPRNAPVEVDFTLLAVPPYGKNVNGYVSRAIEEIKPDVILVDCRPLKLSASMLYAFSMLCAVGLPVYADIISKSNGQMYDGEAFYAGNLNETILIKSWLAKIPVLPVGPPDKPIQPGIYSDRGYLYDAYFWAKWQSGIVDAYHTLDEQLPGCCTAEDNHAMARRIYPATQDSISSDVGNSLNDIIAAESSYIKSRISAIISHKFQFTTRPRILAFVDIVHYPDLEEMAQITSMINTGTNYLPFRSFAPTDTMQLVARNREKLLEDAVECSPASTLAQELFRSEFDKYIAFKDSETLTEQEVYQLVADIAGRTRSHPDAVLGVSVRGTIAFQELIRAYSEIRGNLDRQVILKAALTALPPRLVLKQKGNEANLVNDITKEVLYGIRFSSNGYGRLQSKATANLTNEDILNSLEKFGPIPPSSGARHDTTKIPAVLSEEDHKLERLKYLESMKLLEKDKSGRYSLTQKAVDYILDELEKKLKSGEITPEEYERSKERISALANNSAEPQFSTSSKEMANTVMEMMDAQDRGWNSGVNFNMMHMYYHVKSSNEGAEISPQKRDYYALGRLIDDLEKQQILKTGHKESSFTLTGMALDMLLKYLVERDRKSKGLQGAIQLGMTPSDERKHEVRRYTPGDAFRDISLRHTLREIVKQKKELSAVRNSDFRVFLKQPRKTQSDIIICIDTSGSMGFHHELMYARVVAAGLVHAAIENKDRVGLVAFNDYGQISIPLTEKEEDFLIDCIAGLTVKGNTNIGDGLKCASELLFRNHKGNQKYIILITDGQPTALSEKAFSQLKELKGKDLTEESAILETRHAAVKGAKVSVIHITGRGESSSPFIKNIARIGKGKVRSISKPDDLKTILR
jgi:Mg-chelatase subunit ChlD